MKIKYIRDGRAPIPKNEVTSIVMSANIAKDTKPEIALRKALWQAGIRGYRLHWENVPGRPDIVFTKRKVAIFVNGCFWHRCPHCKLPLPKSNKMFWQQKFNRNIERDKKKTNLLKKAGWKVITIWECELKKNILSTLKTIKKALIK